MKGPLRGEEVTNGSRDVEATKEGDAQARVNAIEAFFKVKAKTEGKILRRELLMQRQETLVHIPDLVKVIQGGKMGLEVRQADRRPDAVKDRTHTYGTYPAQGRGAITLLFGNILNNPMVHSTRPGTLAFTRLQELG